MAQIQTYLTFNGNCREAMTFYQECLGGELQLQTIGSSPMAQNMPPAMQDNILHASLKMGDLILLGSDMVSGDGLVKGNAVSLMLNCGSAAEINLYYSRLSEGGVATFPIEQTFWGALFGGLSDRYGHHWLLHWQQE